MAADRGRGSVSARTWPPARPAARRAARPARAWRVAEHGHWIVRFWVAARLASHSTYRDCRAGAARSEARALVERPELRAGRIVLRPLPTDGPGRALDSFSIG